MRCYFNACGVLQNLRRLFYTTPGYWHLALVSWALFAGASITACGWHGPGMAPRVRNVIIMVPDGSSQSLQTLARWYKGGALNLDGLNSGTAKTYMANSVITGSAAAATAFATGHKTTARFLGIGPRTDDLLTGFEPTAAPYEPVASVLEAAKLQGKAVGLVAVSRISHATPAAFGSHVQDRGLESQIMEQLVYQDLDVAFGGGAGYLIPRDAVYSTSFGARWPGMRSDGENLLDVLRQRGYRWVDHRSQLAAVQKGPVWGLFGRSHMAPQMDKATDSTQPSLADMTAKAIEILAQNPRGFFLLVEGSQVDWGGHGNDPAYMVTEYLAFDEAVGRALSFAQADGRTCVYVWPDHNTGGLTIGNAATFFAPGFPKADDPRPVYTATSIETLVAPLKRMKISAAALARQISDPDDDAQVKSALLAYWGIGATDEDLREIKALKNTKTSAGHSMGLASALGEVISRNHLVVGWTTHGHCGGDVPVWSYGPRPLTGTLDNTELARLTAGALGADLADATERLYVDLSSIINSYSIDTRDAANPGVVIGRDIFLPADKDILRIAGRPHRLEGIVVYAPMAGNAAGKVFVPGDAADLIRNYLSE
jgi:alkaline phosphatase